MNTRVALILWVVSYASAQDPNCDYFQFVQAGTTNYIYSPNYPGNYSPGSQCRWQAQCPPNYNCRLDCSEVRLPYTQSCTMDRLLVSRTGDPQLSGAETYCGLGTLSIVSTLQSISIGLISSSSSPGGRFSCRLTAQVATSPPSQCQCGVRKQNRIVGGQETDVNEFIMLAGLLDLTIYEIKCGATIISTKHVATAAHCVFQKPKSEIAVVVGAHDVNVVSSSTKVYSVANIIIHPLFSQSNYDYDIAIIEVSGTIQFNNVVGPACLPFKFINNDFTGRNVTVIGWGTLFPGGPTSNVPRKVDLNVISQRDCRAKISTLTDRQLCTYTPGKDACQDDSGGPVLYTDPATGLLFSVGIISYGRFCASNDPGINTRLTTLLDWIVVNTNYNYCRK